MKEQQLQKLYKAERIIRLWDKETIAGLEAYLELEKIFAQRPEAPAPRVEQVNPLMDVQWDAKAPAPLSKCARAHCGHTFSDHTGTVVAGSDATPCIRCDCNRFEQAPPQTSCDNSGGPQVIAVPSCVPAPPIPSCIPCSENTLAAGEVPIPYAPAPSCVPAERTFTAGEFEEAARKVGCVASIGWILAALDPPKTKTPQERIEAILSRRGYTWSQDDARSIAAEIVAALSKERP